MLRDSVLEAGQVATDVPLLLNVVGGVSAAELNARKWPEGFSIAGDFGI